MCWPWPWCCAGRFARSLSSGVDAWRSRRCCCSSPRPSPSARSASIWGDGGGHFRTGGGIIDYIRTPAGSGYIRGPPLRPAGLRSHQHACMNDDKRSVLVLIASDWAKQSSRALIQCSDWGHPTKSRLVAPRRAAPYRGRWGPGHRTRGSPELLDAPPNL